jgi:hypothetical protein
MGDHRHDWLAVGYTNLVVCKCGEQRRWWEVPRDQEPFAKHRFVDKDTERAIRGHW